MQSYRFSPDLWMKISKLSKTVHTIFIKFCTVILHPKGPCVRNGIEIIWLECEKHSQNSPKIIKKLPFLDFFPNFRENCPYDSNEILYSHFTPYYDHIYARASKSYDWDSSELEGKRPKRTPSPHIRL